MRSFHLPVAAFLVFLTGMPMASARISSQTAGTATKTDTIGEGVNAAVYIHPSPGARTRPDHAVQKAFDEGRRLYKELDGRTNGEVGQINKNAGGEPVKVSGPLLTLLRVCSQITEWTQGLFDVVRGPSQKKNPDLLVNFETGEVKLPEKKSWVDFSGVRHGYVVDRMAGLLKQEGFSNFMIQSGPVVRTMGRDGNNFWSLNIPDPSGRRNLCRLSLEASSVATVDVRDLQGATGRLGRKMGAPTDLKSVTVITKNATNATALATTALLVGKGRAQSMLRGIAQKGFGAILEDRAGKIQTIGDVTAACFE